MMPDYKISIESQSDSKEVDFVDKQLHQFNVSKIGDYQYTSLFVLLRDSEKKVVGGLEGFLGLGWFHIGTLWITENLRGYGYGKALLLAAEQEAVNRGCLYAYLFTYSFQAPEFYQHLGYEVFGELEDFPVGHRRYFLKKSLQKTLS
ncbi:MULTISPECIES: GNAT family N-acetyltransferase [unclassified Nostoc]|uniref:GNAT family N-acetyltransferase n=1 Tax=unclassified Nostoc TaxID=2593658 RepID=UPI000D0C12A9|nr:GNAT family N-acetyltransferase [Nostoc sp. 'Peltigera membranacea cyanobiont' N6]AVH67615.1 GCN5-related N-acetyltransferase [Nostoc sp. 'Peltigera membranacea cyanobiont' N6]